MFARAVDVGTTCMVGGGANGDAVLSYTLMETSDVTIVVSLSTNNSFEWTDSAGDGIYAADVNPIRTGFGVSTDEGVEGHGI